MIVFYFLCLVAVLSLIGFCKTSKQILFIFALLLILFRTFLAWETWPDLTGYYDDFTYCCKINFSKLADSNFSIQNSNSEPGWIIYCWIISRISSSFYLLLFCTSCIIVFSYFYLISNYVDKRYWAFSFMIVLLGPFFQSMFVLRQHLALSVVFLAYPLLLRRRYLYYIIMVIVAFTIHKTALFSLVILLFCNFKRIRSLVIALCIYGIILLGILAVIGDYANSLLPGYYTYLSSEDATNSTMAIIMSFVLLLRYIMMKRVFFVEGWNRLLSIICIIGVINAWEGVGVGDFMTRLNMYYTELLFLIIPNILSHSKNMFMRRCIPTTYIIVFALVLSKNLKFLVQNSHGYKFLWE